MEEIDLRHQGSDATLRSKQEDNMQHHLPFSPNSERDARRLPSRRYNGEVLWAEGSDQASDIHPCPPNSAGREAAEDRVLRKPN
jgi:hypothetical protein